MKIHALQLETPALAAVWEFYQNHLGLETERTAADTLCVTVGDSELIFKENAASTGIYHFAFNIPCNQIAAAREWLDTCGVRLVRGLQDEEIILFPDWHARSVYFFDPAGNLVELIARDDLNNTSVRVFGPESLLQISEIGIVVPEVGAWRMQAERDFGIGPFDKQPPLPGFAALGDDHGLFIVVPEGRHWLFTDIPATTNRLRVDFTNEKRQPFQWST